MNCDSKQNENDEGYEDQSFEDEGGIDDEDSEFCVVHGLISSDKKDPDTCSSESEDMV